MKAVALFFFLNTGFSEASGLRPFGARVDRLQPKALRRRLDIGGIVEGFEDCWHNCAQDALEGLGNSPAGQVAQDTLNGAATFFTGVGNAVEGSWEAVADATNNFVGCMENTFNDPGCPDAPSLDDLADWCFLIFGDRFEDGFRAGCWIPELSATVQFGDAEGDDKDRALLTLSAGSALEYELNVFQNEWKNAARGRLKEHVALEAGVSFNFINPVELAFKIDNGLKFDFHMPGMRMNFGSTMTLYAEHSEDPCADRDDECRMYLNKGKDRIFSKAFAAGPVPVYIEVNAKVYVQATPTFDGRAETTLSIGLSDKAKCHTVTYDNDYCTHTMDWVTGCDDWSYCVGGDMFQEDCDRRGMRRMGICVNLDALNIAPCHDWATRDTPCPSTEGIPPGFDVSHSAKLPLHDPAAAVRALQNSFNFNEVKESLLHQLTINVDGGLEASAELELCVGVELSFHINGLGSTLDIPVCLTAAMALEASAGLNSGAQASAEASLTLNALEFPYSIDLPDPAALIDSACGLISEFNPLADVCAPVVTCANNFAQDTCEGLGEAWSQLQLTLLDGTIQLIAEQELWSHSVSLEFLGGSSGGGGSSGAAAPSPRCRTKTTMCSLATLQQCNANFPAIWTNAAGHWDHQALTETKGLCVIQDGRCTTKSTLCEWANHEQCHSPNFNAVWGKTSTAATRMCEWVTSG